MAGRKPTWKSNIGIEATKKVIGIQLLARKRGLKLSRAATIALIRANNDFHPAFDRLQFQTTRYFEKQIIEVLHFWPEKDRAEWLFRTFPWLLQLGLADNEFGTKH